MVRIEAFASHLPLKMLVEQRSGYEPLTAALARNPDPGVDSNVSFQRSLLTERLVADLRKCSSI